MLKEQLKMSNEQAQQISSMLQRQGLTEIEINEILNGEYSSFQTDMDLTQIFSSDGNYQNVLRGLADGYSIDELQQQGVSARQNYNTNTNSQRRNPFSRRKQEESQYDNKNTPEQQTFQPKQKSQEKKSWELEPEEKARIQRETAEIAKRFREQEEQQKQTPTQEMQQGNIQQGDFTQMQQGQMPQQIPQQPMQDFGGMEL